jgi:hypothetical protein
MIDMELVGVLVEGEPEEHLKQIRGRKTYANFKKIVTHMKAGDTFEAMKSVFSMMERMRAFRSNAGSMYAEESLELVLREEGLWHGQQ